MPDPITRKPTIIDVASLAGVSIKTVSRVINNERHVSIDMRTRVRQAVAELGFEANESARGMRCMAPEKSYVVAHLYGDAGGLYTHDVQLGLMERCCYFGYHLVVEGLDYQSPDIERRAADMLTDFQEPALTVLAYADDAPARLNRWRALRELFDIGLAARFHQRGIDCGDCERGFMHILTAELGSNDDLVDPAFAGFGSILRLLGSDGAPPQAGGNGEDGGVNPQAAAALAQVHYRLS